MDPSKTNSRGYKGLTQFMGKWVYEPVQRYFSPESSNPVAEKQSSSFMQPMTQSADNRTENGVLNVVLPDGATLAYEVLGSHNLAKATPVVMICGMTALREDSEQLPKVLARSHPVLIYDHRGMGGSSLSPKGDEEITIELMARDLLFLLTHLKWRQVALCGHSMGGVIAQQLLVLPYHPTKPTRLPFRTTHLFLIGTRCKVHLGVGLPLTAVPGKPRSVEERREGARKVIAASLDPTWIEANSSRFEHLFGRVVNNSLSNRPADVIAKQGVALRRFDFERLLDYLPRDIQVLIIHGQLDQVIPFSCGQDIMKRIPWARVIEEGSQPGKVPTLKFGHLWYEYFDPQIWCDVLHEFVVRPTGPPAKD
ncbi:alpha/beta-hydrolase [Macrolepiota fuliginosa MF-IS2]|uniref:Alpha/beta-hydrolase n=1 Tax=Macrolepiota fuliginosa MF-IS2 TaxID=1400762 RepID=A0A9P5X519_9AGAR|nr:alpha/beta-hydrolase [Macrolepiota fuliginosa MF-IS2]